MPRHLTTVYTINDEKGFEPEQNRLLDFFQESKGKPWAITAMSVDHEIHRLYLVEEAHQRGRHDLLDDIFGLVETTQYEDLNEFIAANELAT